MFEVAVILLLILVFVFLLDVRTKAINLNKNLKLQIEELHYHLSQQANKLKRLQEQLSSQIKSDVLEDVQKRGGVRKEKEPKLRERPLKVRFEQTDEVEEGNIFKKPEQPPLKQSDKAEERSLVVSGEGKTRGGRDWEKLIGENWLGKVGIVVLVLGLGFFIKYAIDQDWIGEVGRVLIGVFSGFILMGLAHWLRKRYQAFSSVLIGGALSVLYFTVAFAFHEYGLLSQLVSFLMMVAITGGAVALSLFYDRRELAVLAILGGFGTPLMVSTGGGSHVVLFSYITILNLGMLVLAYFKKWQAVSLTAYISTVLLYGLWLIDSYQSDSVPYSGALFFAGLFYFLFFLMNTVSNLKKDSVLTTGEVMLLLSNSALFLVVGLLLLNSYEPDYQGFFTASVGLFNLLVALFLYRRRGVERRLFYFLLGVAVSFLTLAIPIQFDLYLIVCFWSFEFVLLLLFWRRFDMSLLRYAGLLVGFVMLLSLFMSWHQFYFEGSAVSLNWFLNKVWLAGMFSIASSLFASWWIGGSKLSAYNREALRLLSLIVSVVLLYVVQFLELRHQLFVGGWRIEAINIYIGLYNYLFLLVLLLVSYFGRIRYIFEGSLVLSFVGLLAYMVFYHLEVIVLREAYLSGDSEFFGAFRAHYIMVALLFFLTFMFVGACQRFFREQKVFVHLSLWFGVIVSLFALSTELEHALVLARFPYGEVSLDRGVGLALSDVRRIGWPILWGLSSFILMVAGMRLRNKNLRIISLTVFIVILVKLFAFDVWSMSSGGKIAAFISLGVLLLVISFLYQRVRRIVFDSEQSDDFSDD